MTFLGMLVAACALSASAGGALVTDAPVSGLYANGPVYALLRAGDGTIYVGGDFTQICTSTTVCSVRSRIAHVSADGALLPALGAGTETATNRAVRALAMGGDGALYAGGDFSAIGGVGIGNAIARWDGSSWTALRTGVEGPVFAIAVVGTDVFVGGDFAGAAGTTLGNVARWNGSTWAPLGLGASGPVYALAPGAGGVVAGGAFDRMIGAAPETARIARWDGAAWQPLAGGVTGTYDEVRALAISGSEIYAGGTFTVATADGEAHNVARWDGSAWRALGQGADGPVNALALAGSELYAGGDFLALGAVLSNRLAGWNGTSWAKIGAGADAAVRALVVTPDGQRLLAGGTFTRIGSAGHPNLALLQAPAAADRVAPKLTTVIPKQRLRTVLSKGLKVKITCDEATKVAVRASVRGRRVGEITVTVKAKAVTTVTVKLTTSSVRRLKPALRVPFSASASAVDRAGNHGTVSTALQIKR